MKKTLYTVIMLCLFSRGIAQKSHHYVYAGINLTATGSDFRSLDLNYSTYETFKNPKAGFTFGYKYIFKLNNFFSISGGLELVSFRSVFSRKHYDNSLNSDPRSIFENIKMLRFSLPVQGYCNFVKRKKLILYATGGAGLYFVNNANRRADYYIPGPPTGYIKYTYTGNQSVKFGKENHSIGLSLFGGIGGEFEVVKQYFTAELYYCGDISKSKFLTLHNIEGDSYFLTKFKCFQLSVGYAFSFSHKKK